MEVRCRKENGKRLIYIANEMKSFREKKNKENKGEKKEERRRKNSRKIRRNDNL